MTCLSDNPNCWYFDRPGPDTEACAVCEDGYATLARCEAACDADDPDCNDDAEQHGQFCICEHEEAA